MALILNGFFPVIRRITPVVRSLSAFAGGCVWLALTIGFTMYNSNVLGIVAPTPAGASSTSPTPSSSPMRRPGPWRPAPRSRDPQGGPAVPPPATPEGGFADVWAFLGTVAAAATVVVGNFIRGWRRAKEGNDVVARTVVLERADLADLTDVQRLLIEIRPRLEQLYDVERINKSMLEGNRERMDEVLRGMRRLEGELDIAKRLREEEILRVNPARGGAADRGTRWPGVKLMRDVSGQSAIADDRNNIYLDSGTRRAHTSSPDRDGWNREPDVFTNFDILCLSRPSLMRPGSLWLSVDGTTVL